MDKHKHSLKMGRRQRRKKNGVTNSKCGAIFNIMNRNSSEEKWRPYD